VTPSCSAPAKRFDHGYAKNAYTLLAFGGKVSFSNASDELFEYTISSATWNSVSKKSSSWPAARFDTVLLGNDKRFTLISGSTNKTNVINDVWQYNSHWNKITVRQGKELLDKTCHSGISIPILQKMIIFGGRYSNGTLSNEIVVTNREDASQWHLITPRLEKAPSPRQWTQIVFVPPLGGFVFFGGFTGKVSVNGFWLFSLEQGIWKELDSPVSARSGHNLFYDDLNQILVLFGGDDADGKGMNDLWIYHVKTSKWEQVAVETQAPTPRSAAAAYLIKSSEKQIQFMIFGGVFWDKSEILSDLWHATITL
jgi:hypothetical protein